MNGFGGIVGYGANASAQFIENMHDALKNRGTDTFGTYISQDLCLIHTGRESRQPLRAVLGQKAYVIAFDGELYNKEELKKELSVLGHRFQDNSCAAVALYSYMAWGQPCVERFNGVFAFVIWDNDRLFAARDRLGIKPLYYSNGDFGLVFASTIKAVLSYEKIEPILTESSIAELILLGPGHSPGCGIFKNIKELAPGECFYYKNGTIETKTYWRLKAKIHQDNFAQTVETIRHLLSDAIQRQTNGNEAVLLSGGLDSSAVCALSRLRNTFSLDFVGSKNNDETDEHFVDIVVRHLGTTHKKIVLGSDELADALADAVAARGFPGMADIDASLLLFLRHIGERHSTVLTGDGADEIFGGYPWCQSEEIPSTFPWAQNVDYRASFIKPGLVKHPREYVQSRFANALASANTLYDDDKTEKQARQMFNMNLGWFMQTLASRTDSMAAAAKVNARTPFLDYRLVEYMYNVPWEFKNYGGREKGLLREVLKGTLPEAIIERKKSPFPKTHNPGYLNRVQDMLKVVLNDHTAPIFSVVSKNALSKLVENDTSNTNWYGQLMAYPQTIAYFLQINEWLKTLGIKM